MMYIAHIDNIDQYSKNVTPAQRHLKRTFHDNIDHKALFLKNISFVTYERVSFGNVQRETYTL